MSFTQDLDASFRRDLDAEMVEYRGRHLRRREMVAFADRLNALLDRAGAPSDAFAAVVVRNRPLIAAGLVGLITRERPMRSVYSFQPAAGVAADTAGYAAVVAETQDWSPELTEAVRAAGALGVRLDLDAEEPVAFAAGLETLKVGDWRRCEGEMVLEMLSSGTTGKPKPVRFPYRLLTRAVESSARGRVGDGLKAADIVIWPYGGIGGICNLCADVYLGRHMTILEKFNVEEWVAAVRKRRPSFVSVTTTILRMIYDAGVSPEDLASIRHYWGGSMHLPPDFQDAFEERYGTEIIWALGATEFCGTILAWTPELKREFGAAKRGSVGRPFAGTEVRVVDGVTGQPLPPGQVGFIEVRAAQLGPDWIRATDLAVVDEDGFFFHRGRGDGAIVRGGFKILPEKLVEAIASHPAVLEGAVVGADDERLGQVPVAYVELRRGVGPVGEAELIAHAARLLAKTQMPVRILVLDRLPRTTSTKAALGELRKRAGADLRQQAPA